MMNAKTERIQARVEPELKAAAEAVFSKLGLSSGDAIRLFYRQVELHDGLPFPVKIPNKETLEAMAETQESTMQDRYGSFADVRKDLGV